jgi:hypothetical protein
MTIRAFRASLDAMTRTEAIAIINAKLPALDDDGVAAVAEIVEQMTQEPVHLDLTDEELAAIERSREDFKAGRTYSSAEARAITSAFLAKLDVADRGT